MEDRLYFTLAMCASHTLYFAGLSSAYFLCLVRNWMPQHRIRFETVLSVDMHSFKRIRTDACLVGVCYFIVLNVLRCSPLFLAIFFA